MRRSGGHSDLGTLVFQHQICLDRSEQGPLGTWVQPAYMLCWVLWVALICSDTAVASECCDTVTLGWMNIGLVRVWLGGSESYGKELLSELTKIKTSHSLRKFNALCQHNLYDHRLRWRYSSDPWWGSPPFPSPFLMVKKSKKVAAN